MSKIFGFTYIELLISMSILALIGLWTIPYATSFIGSNNLRLTQDALTSMTRKAQSYSLANRNNTVWGICLYDSNIRLYSGSCNSPTVKDDYPVPKSVTVSGLNDFDFTKLRGEIPSSQHITLSTQFDSVGMEITPLGAVIVN